MIIPKKLMIDNASYALDGGSISILAKDPDDNNHQIGLEIDFYSIENSHYLGQVSRLYFNNVLVPVRSEAEELLLKSLREAEIKKEDWDSNYFHETPIQNNDIVNGQDIQDFFKSPPKGSSNAIDDLIACVESEDYVTSLQEEKLQSQKVRITLLTIGKNRVSVIYLLKKYLTIHYEDAKSIVGQTPIEIAVGSKVKLTGLIKGLRSVGAKVDVSDID